MLPLIAEDSSLAYWQAAALNVMSDSTSAPEEALPKTGVPKAIEQALSSVYIDAVALSNTDTPMPSYGTRTQSILTLRGEDKSEVKAQLINRETDNVKC